MPKTQYELNDKAKEIMAQFEDWDLWEAEIVLGNAKQQLCNNAIVKLSPLAHQWLPSEPHMEEVPQK